MDREGVGEVWKVTRDYWLAWSLGLCVGIVLMCLVAILIMTWGLV